MANKLLKHFGLGGKKVSTQPSPSREFSGKTSGSTQELRSKSPTKNRSSTIVVPSSGSATVSHVRPDADARRHSDASAVRNSLPNRGGGTVSRSRPTVTSADWSSTSVRGSQSKDPRERALRKSGTISSSSSLRSGTAGRRFQDGATEMSSQLVKSPDGARGSVRSPLSSTSSANGLPPRILDEYSDPFDVKKEIEQSVNATEATSATSPSPLVNDEVEDEPQMPDDDYSVPYELKKQALGLAAEQIEEAPVTPATPDVPKYDDPYDEGPALFRSLSMAEETESLAVHSASESPAAPVPVACGKSASLPDCTATDTTDSVVTELHKNENTVAGTIAHVQTTVPFDADSATYDEPWDLRAARLGLENRLRAAQPPMTQTASQMQIARDMRTAVVDPRPALEYDEPWDRRARDIQRNLISAKSAKEEARVLREGFGTMTGMHSQSASSGSCRSDSHRNFSASSDMTRSGTSSKSTADSTCFHHSSNTGASMSKHRCSQDSGGGGSPLWRTVAERIDPHVPLEQQGWYHGSISRVNAETLLRVHREGSYLVRMSESNRSDYSLSLKSSRGFMHMKIVGCDDGSGCGHRYILGQFSQPFDSIPQMIHHYTINKLPIKGAEHMSLLHPINNELL